MGTSACRTLESRLLSSRAEVKRQSAHGSRSVFNGTNSDFLLKNVDFLSKNVDFLLKNVDFPSMQNVDFIIKQTITASVTLTIGEDEFDRNMTDHFKKGLCAAVEAGDKGG